MEEEDPHQSVQAGASRRGRPLLRVEGPEASVEHVGNAAGRPSRHSCGFWLPAALENLQSERKHTGKLSLAGEVECPGCKNKKPETKQNTRFLGGGVTKRAERCSRGYFCDDGAAVFFSFVFFFLPLLQAFGVNCHM